MTQDEKKKRAPAVRTQGARQTRSRASQVRSRCSGDAGPEAVTEEVAAAMPQIVRATVKRAKDGSLPHTKWLWAIAQTAQSAEAEKQMGARQSLALLLMEQLEREG